MLVRKLDKDRFAEDPQDVYFAIFNLCIFLIAL